MFREYLLVGLGAALGGMARFACANLAVRLFGPAFPWGTLFVNVSGSLVAGVVAGWIAADRRSMESGFRAFLLIGICGGYTTFSSFSLETVQLARDGFPARAAANALLSLVLCLTAAFGGLMMGSAWMKR
ncbi:MAG: fluoride efflux transporter CrcB [Bryobacteraceae bacterium]|nr:fluoride efflux transporter CrcB [Bryobacteraceae bacterium]